MLGDVNDLVLLLRSRKEQRTGGVLDQSDIKGVSIIPSIKSYTDCVPGFHGIKDFTELFAVWHSLVVDGNYYVVGKDTGVIRGTAFLYLIDEHANTWFQTVLAT